MGNETSERGVLPCSKVTKKEGEMSSFFWCTECITAHMYGFPDQNYRKGGGAPDVKNPDPYYYNNGKQLTSNRC